jgi:ABC-type bacteriocin/lantibiotic exporter with double-glycine peptidase domain
MTPVNLRGVWESQYLEGLRGLRPILTTDMNLCASAAVATGLRFLGHRAHLDGAVEAIGSSAAGLDYRDLLRYILKRDVKAQATYKTPVNAIVERAKQGRVTLIDWKDHPHHWLLVAGVDAVLGVLVLVDCSLPRSGFVGYMLSDFEQFWGSEIQTTGKLPQLILTMDRPRPGTKSVPSKQTDIRAREFGRTKKYYTPVGERPPAKSP